jgi:outer membrane protein assembly factor BamD
VLPLLAGLLAGCATAPTQETPEPSADLRRALQGGDCRAAYNALDTQETVAVETRLAVARVCLQRGEFTRTRDLTEALLDEAPAHPDADYAAYLRALAHLGTWNRATAVPLRQHREHGRQVFRELAAFLQDYPMSRYTESLAPRLARLREDLADIELRIADAVAESGNEDEARARTEYVRDYYPGTRAARAANDRLDTSEQAPSRVP